MRASRIWRQYSRTAYGGENVRLQGEFGGRGHQLPAEFDSPSLAPGVYEHGNKQLELRVNAAQSQVAIPVRQVRNRYRVFLRYITRLLCVGYAQDPI